MDITPPSFDILPPSRFLELFEEEDRRILSSYGNFVRYRAGEVIIGEGRRQDRLCCLLEGILDVVHVIEGGSAPLGTIRTGEWFGEINILDPAEASATVIANKPSQIWRMTRERLEEYLNAYPGQGCVLLLGIGEMLARRTRDLLGRFNATWDMA